MEVETDTVEGQTVALVLTNTGEADVQVSVTVSIEVFACSLHLDMQRIPAGTFTMGKPTDEVSYYDGSDEILHQVELTNDFCMGTNEVTEAEFQDYMGYPSSYFQCMDCPTDCLTWHEAAAFANEVSDREGVEQCYDCTGGGDKVLCDLASDLSSPYECGGFRLPTEAEWEYAARAGTTAAFSCGGGSGGNLYEGDEDDRDGDVLLDNGAYLDDYAIWVGTAPGQSATVGSKLPNPWGLYDMHGNVYEYCQDWYQEDYGGDAIDPWGPGTSDRKVRRSGSWNAPSAFLRSASRAVSYPETQGGYFVGFRLARTAQ